MGAALPQQLLRMVLGVSKQPPEDPYPGFTATTLYCSHNRRQLLHLSVCLMLWLTQAAILSVGPSFI